MSERGKALIVGGGIAGLSTAWALNRRGFEVELFEQGPLPNPISSSYDEHRIIRHAYGELEGYAFLMPEAFSVWRRLFEDIGATHLKPMPALYIMRGDTSWVAPTVEQLDALGIGYRTLTAEETARRHPMIATDALGGALETEGAGMLFPIRILTDLVVALAAAGVRFHSGSLVSEIDPESAALTVGGRRVQGDVLVVAAGAWVNRLLPQTRGRAVPSRQAVLFLAPPQDLAEAWNAAPIFIDMSEESGTYTLPPRNSTRLKIGDHHFSRTGDPDGDRSATDADLERLLQGARAAYRDLGRYTVLERKACFYTVAEDERFMVEPAGAKAWMISACSGHGFKLGPLMGEGLARAVAGEWNADDLSIWAAGRRGANASERTSPILP